MANITQRMSAAHYLESLSRRTGVGATPARTRASKYGNTKVGAFDSVKEARVAQMLELMRQAANPQERVTQIEHHVRYEVIPKQDGERATHYEADFRVTYADGRIEVIDVKSDITRKEARYILKRKLMLQVHGIKIREM